MPISPQEWDQGHVGNWQTTSGDHQKVLDCLHAYAGQALTSEEIGKEIASQRPYRLYQILRNLEDLGLVEAKSIITVNGQWDIYYRLKTRFDGKEHPVYD